MQGIGVLHYSIIYKEKKGLPEDPVITIRTVVLLDLPFCHGGGTATRLTANQLHSGSTQDPGSLLLFPVTSRIPDRKQV